MSLLLKNGTYIHPETLEFTTSHILVEEGVNGKISFIKDIPDNNSYPILDCSGKFITQSFVCGHHHVYSALARGMGAPRKNPQNFNEILEYVWWTLDKCLDADMIEASALYTAMACIKNGVTFVIDHHASPNFIKGSLEIIANAFEKVGASHLLCYEITDRDGLDKTAEGLNETTEYLKTHQGLVGLHASFTVSDDTMKKAVELAKQANSGIHIHVAEAESDQDHCVSYYGMRVIERLQKFGALESGKTILGHCLHLSDNEKNIIRDSPVWMVQNTESNLNNKVGFFNAEGLGEHIMMGTDGMHSDMLRSAKAAFFVGQNFDTIGYDSVYQRFRNADKYLQTNGFTGHGPNNLVVLDYDTPTPFNTGNFYGHFVFGLESRHVQHVISQGRLVVENRKILTVDEYEILANARIQAERLWKKMKK
jgi:cytosine/adenosine deaminase-related metal-dependent hydrolase